MKNIYRFDNGHLYVLQGDAYVHCYYHAYETTKKLAIRAYEDDMGAQAQDELEELYYSD